MYLSLTPRVRTIFASILLVLLAAATPGAEEPGPDNVVTVVATRRIEGGNIASAKQAAVDAALTAAVDQRALIAFSPEAVAAEFKPFSTAVAGNAEKFIDSYKILGESSADGYYRVMVQAEVSLDQLRTILGNLQPAAAAGAGSVQAVDRPRILFLLSEQNIKDLAPKFWWGQNAAPVSAHTEAAIMEKAREAGFVVIEHGDATPDVRVKAAIVFQPELGNRDASEIGRLMGADVVIVGKTIVYAVGETGTGGAPAYNATITVRAVRVDTGQEITTGFETAVRQGPNETEGSREALTAVGIQAADHLIPSIASAWENIVHPTENITLTVLGSGNLGNFVRFRQELGGIDGVRDFQIQQMNANEAVIAVRFEGNAQELGEHLRNNAFELFSIDIITLSNRGLEIALVPK